jgi:threonine dehydrogenase-like Zn-dependent dehydrogenase
VFGRGVRVPMPFLYACRHCRARLRDARMRCVWVEGRGGRLLWSRYFVSGGRGWRGGRREGGYEVEVEVEVESCFCTTV